jgi:hypothetical protein
VVERIYLQPERPRISDLLRAVETECRQRGLKAPTFHTLQARLRELDQDDLVRRRFGPIEARQRFGPLGWSSLQPTYSLADVMGHARGERARRAKGVPHLPHRCNKTIRGHVFGKFLSLL